MNISTKSEYDLRALIYLAGDIEGGAIPAREIAERWSAPVKYLEQILKALKEAGIVASPAGVGGGYRLGRPAARIAIGAVIREIDGRLAPMGCVSSYDYEPCEFENACGLKTLWARARAALVGVLDKTTIAVLCTQADRQQVVSLNSSSGSM